MRACKQSNNRATPEPLSSPAVAIAVLAGAGLLEGYTMSVAWEEIKREAEVCVYMLEYIYVYIK